MKSCTFIGHHFGITNGELLKILESEIEHLIKEEDVSIFYLANYKDFDKQCLHILLDIKDKYKYIKIVHVLINYNYKPYKKV